MPSAGDSALQAVLLSERLLSSCTRPLGPSEATGRAKVLLTRNTSTAAPVKASALLDPITTDADWFTYERARVVVEAGFGVDAVEAKAMVAALRTRCERLSLDMYWVRSGDSGAVVGAVGRYRLPEPFPFWGRLQEVDVFPDWRGRGHGDALLAAVLELMAREGVTDAVVGADEDDWPLSWYRRREFRDAVRVPPIA